MAEKQLDQELTQTEQRQSRLKELIAKGKEQGYLTYAEVNDHLPEEIADPDHCLLYTSPSPRDRTRSRMPSSA